MGNLPGVPDTSIDVANAAAADDKRIDVALLGDNIVIPAPGPSKRTLIGHLDMQAQGAVTVLIKSGSTAKAGPYTFTALAGIAFDFPSFSPWGMGVNEPLVLELSAAVRVTGLVTFRTAT